MTRILKSHRVLSGDVRPLILTHDVHELARDRGSRQDQSQISCIEEQTIAINQQAAAKILEQARCQAQEILNQAQIQAEQLMQDAKAHGFAKGIQRAKEEYDLKTHELQLHLEEVIQNLNVELEYRLNELEPELIDLSLSIAEKILNIELVRDERSFVSLVRSAINQLKTSKEIQIRINEADLAHLTAEFGFQPQNPDQNITFKTEPNLKPGSLFLDCESGTINASVSTQLSKIRLHLKEVQP